MDHDDFRVLFDYQIDRAASILVQKAEEYATNDDRLHNFRVAAKIQGTTEIAALGGMMAKHTTSIYDMIRESSQGRTYEYGQWDEKITDHINYLILLRAIVAEPEFPKENNA